MNRDNENNKFWDDVAPSLQESLNIGPITEKQAQKAYNDAPELKITEDEIDHLLDFAISNRPKDIDQTDHTFNKDAKFLEEEIYQLHRNEGDEDADDLDIDEMMENQRREALEDDEENDEKKDD